MKRTLFLGLAGAAALAATVCVILNVDTKDATSDLMTKNIEALTQNEGGGVHCCNAVGDDDYATFSVFRSRSVLNRHRSRQIFASCEPDFHRRQK